MNDDALFTAMAAASRQGRSASPRPGGGRPAARPRARAPPAGEPSLCVIGKEEVDTSSSSPKSRPPPPAKGSREKPTSGARNDVLVVGKPLLGTASSDGEGEQTQAPRDAIRSADVVLTVTPPPEDDASDRHSSPGSSLSTKKLASGLSRERQKSPLISPTGSPQRRAAPAPGAKLPGSAASGARRRQISPEEDWSATPASSPSSRPPKLASQPEGSSAQRASSGSGKQSPKRSGSHPSKGPKSRSGDPDAGYWPTNRATVSSSGLVRETAYQQRRAIAMAQAKYRESISYAKRRETITAIAMAEAERTGKEPRYQSFAEYRKSLSYTARRGSNRAMAEAAARKSALLRGDVSSDVVAHCTQGHAEQSLTRPAHAVASSSSSSSGYPGQTAAASPVRAAAGSS